MITDRHREELRVKGYTVVENVLTNEEADKYRGMYCDWLATFKDTWPHTFRSLVQRYKVGHMEPAWAVRLKSKKVFAEIWGTEKLHSSITIAIARPPEDGEEEFLTPGKPWLHIDQTQDREGLHAYQGAVYLETVDEDDFAFEVIEGSHEYFDRYYVECDNAIKKRKENPTWSLKKLTVEDIDFFTKERGLKRRPVPVQKGGVILWDSRLIHGNTRPVEGRKNPGRWRFAIFVCMTPAKWTDKESWEKKRKIYDNMIMTGHWSNNGIGTFTETLPPDAAEDPNQLTEHPPSARTKEAKQLAGVLPYESSDEDDDVMAAPKFRLEFMTASQPDRVIP